LLRFIGLLGFDQIEKDFQALFRRERTVVFAVRLVGFGEGVKYAGCLFHPASVSYCPAGYTEMFGPAFRLLILIAILILRD
jgi:hypothetical protein